MKEGKLRALAVTTGEADAQRATDSRLWREAGVPGHELVGWYAFLAPQRHAAADR